MVGLRRILRLTRRETMLLGQALVAVTRVRLYLWRSKHRELRRLIDSYPVSQDSASAAVPHAVLAEVAWSVRNAARLVPGATCLTQASAGQILLAKRGHASTIRLSVPARAAVAGELAPHAWLISDDTILLGGTPADYARHRPLHDFPLPSAPRI